MQHQDGEPLSDQIKHLSIWIKMINKKVPNIGKLWCFSKFPDTSNIEELRSHLLVLSQHDQFSKGCAWVESRWFLRFGTVITGLGLSCNISDFDVYIAFGDLVEVHTEILLTQVGQVNLLSQCCSRCYWWRQYTDPTLAARTTHWIHLRVSHTAKAQIPSLKSLIVWAVWGPGFYKVP